LESQINGLGGELVGLYYADLYGAGKTVSAVSDVMDGDGWTGGWRITDSAAQTIYVAENPANPGVQDYLFSVTPNVFIVDTTTMKIVAAELGGAPATLDVISVLQSM
jgi:hypothetical protein